MIILLGSESGQKAAILRDALETLLTEDFKIVPCRVDSGIAEQPLDKMTTRQGAINRAVHAAEMFGSAYDFSFGLEAGLEAVDGFYYFVSLAAVLRSDGSLSVGESGLIPLPRMVSERVFEGEYLGGIIREYRNQPELSGEEKEAVENLINRRKGLTEAILDAWSGHTQNMVL